MRAGERNCEREIFNLFLVSKCKGFYSFKLEKNTMRKILKLNIFHLVEKIVRFLVDCGRQIRIALFTNMRIDLVTVFDAILTSRQTREKLQCLYENLMSNNFRKTAVLNKILIVN